MALTRKFLSAMGIDEDKAGEIISAHLDTVNALKDERDALKAKADKYEDVQKQLDAANEKLKAQGDSGYEEKYNSLKREYDEYRQRTEADKAKAAKETAYRALLKERGVSDKRLDSILKVTDLRSVSLEKGGKLKDRDALLRSVREEWRDFIPTTTQQGASTATPPANNGGTTATRREIMAIRDTTKRQKAIADNLNLFEKGE